MATIRPKALPLVTTVTAGDVVILDGATVRSITAANFITSAVNLTGVITSVGNATSIGSQTGTGSKFVVDTAPTLVTPVLGVATATSINKLTLTAPATGSTLTIPDGVVLTGPPTSGTVMTLGNAETVSGVKSFNDGTVILKGVTSGTTMLKSGGTAGSSVLTLPVATDTLVGKATTDTLTNKTFDTAGTGNVLKVGSVTVLPGQYFGDASGGSANAGNIGEYIESPIALGSAVALVTATAKTITSIPLTAGDWDVDISCGFSPAATTSITYLLASLSLVTNTLDTTLGRFSGQFMNATVTGGAAVAMPVPPLRLVLASPTTVYFVAQGTFTVAALSAYGIIRARRVR